MHGTDFRPSAGEQEHDEEEVLQSFLQWLVANGVQGIGQEDSKVALFASGGGERGLVCELPVAPGEALLEVPLRLALTDHPGDEESNTLLYEGAPWSVRLSCRLLRHRAAGKASPWAPYVRVLPSLVPSPLNLFEWDDISALRYPPAEEALHSTEWLQSDAFGAASPEARGGLGEADFKWALSVVHSRTFANAAPGGGVGVRMLVPLVDMMNHGGDEAPAGSRGLAGPGVATDNVRWDLVGPDRSSTGGWAMVVSATRAIAPGQELLLSYGERPSDDFFLHYGFVPRANTHDDAVLWPDLEAALEWHYGRFGSQLPREEAEAAYGAALESGLEEQRREQAARAGPGAGSTSEPFPEEIARQLRQIKVVAGGLTNALVVSAFAAVSGGDTAAAERAVALRCAELLGAMAAPRPDLSLDLGDVEGEGEGGAEQGASTAAAGVGAGVEGGLGLGLGAGVGGGGLLVDLAALAADEEPRLAAAGGGAGGGEEGYWAQQLGAYCQALLPRFAPLLPEGARVSAILSAAAAAASSSASSSASDPGLGSGSGSEASSHASSSSEAPPSPPPVPSSTPSSKLGRYGAPPPSLSTPTPTSTTPSPIPTTPTTAAASTPVPLGAVVRALLPLARVHDLPLTHSQRLSASFRAAKQMVLWDAVLGCSVPVGELAEYAARAAGRRSLDNFGDAGYWQKVCPELHIGGKLAVKPLPKPKDVITDARKQIDSEGVVQFAPSDMAWGVDVDGLAHSLVRLMQHGWPSPFLVLFDEVWALIHRASSLMSSVSGGNAVNMDVLAWYVDPNQGGAGFSPHRDRQPDDSPATFRPDGSPMYSTCWVPLTDACPENSCLYMIPRWADPGYHAGDDDDGPDPLSVAMGSKEAFQAIRAFPAEAGSAIMFTHRIIHWGSRGRKGFHTPRVAVSWGCAADEYEPSYFSREHLPYPPTALRAALACGQMMVYHERFPMTKKQLSLYYKFFMKHAAEFHPSYRDKVVEEFMAASAELVGLGRGMGGGGGMGAAMGAGMGMRAAAGKAAAPAAAATGAAKEPAGKPEKKGKKRAAEEAEAEAEDEEAAPGKAGAKAGSSKAAVKAEAAAGAAAKPSKKAKKDAGEPAAAGGAKQAAAQLEPAKPAKAGKQDAAKADNKKSKKELQLQEETKAKAKAAKAKAKAPVPVESDDEDMDGFGEDEDEDDEDDLLEDALEAMLDAQFSGRAVGHDDFDDDEELAGLGGSGGEEDEDEEEEEDALEFWNGIKKGDKGAPGKAAAKAADAKGAKKDRAEPEGKRKAGQDGKAEAKGKKAAAEKAAAESAAAQPKSAKAKAKVAQLSAAKEEKKVKLAKAEEPKAKAKDAKAKAPAPAGDGDSSEDDLLEDALEAMLDAQFSGRAVGHDDFDDDEELAGLGGSGGEEDEDEEEEEEGDEEE
ncbi:hypothetical protein HYH03_004247 [Edaphochlamys debaryana]|uniref:SET domain-containing protein n=1 Tax=Edaphochlamys debaryana TaxID=47281 RepID=A0A835Y8E4_9CHLO|nr:hypothetical protein HYH03_004247 [Edaphochlamys debaryana]|eukprot:KAG2497988.1 hypothetical protein HYH03_004247 [Edaphochlamys debaryana]